jgi:hypothetical protein
MSLCLTKYHAMKTSCPYISTEVSFTPLPSYLQGKDNDTHWIGGWVGPRASLNTVANGKNPEKQKEI